MSFDPKKPVQTRDGRKARIICTDVNSYEEKWPIVALITHPNGCEMVKRYSPSGHISSRASECHDDLVNVPVERTYWGNFYSEDQIYLYTTQEEADDCASGHRIACVKITFKDGDGL